MTKIKRFLSLLLSASLAFTPPLAYPAFDPVNDDTDIFLANPNITAERPNVLIVLDNTANWNQPFVNEKSALVQVINNLSDQFNVGLMMMVETGSPNDNTFGGYVRYHVRQMTSTNKTNLASLVNNLHILNDKGNKATHGLAMYEAYLYYGGKIANAGDGKSKTDHSGTQDPLLVPLSGGRALPGVAGPPALPIPDSQYASPVADGCQKNFIIFISNGQAAENADDRRTVENALATLTGQTPPAIIGLTPSGQQGNWADEMAKYMANADVNANFDGVQNVYTYVVEVNPQLTGLGPDMTALMKSTASNGKGKYFGVTDDASGAAIVDALNAIFTEIQAVNSVFAATTLPVSVNVRGTNLNQVYVGVFRPDANKSPRWLGNLKMYQLALDTATNTVFLADAAGNPAENPTTGFVTGSARSFWTSATGFWGFRDAALNGVGGPSDLPDGDLVEKGGAAEQIRLTYPNAQTPQGGETLRRVYTCTNGGSFTSQCVPSAGGGAPGSSLSATPFADNNTDITANLLDLGTRLVSPLTGFETKAVTSLTDRRAATITNAATPIPVASLSNGATTRTITSLTTAVPKVVTSLSASVPNIQNNAISSIAKSGAAFVVTTTSALQSAFVAGASVTISGNSVSSYNGVWSIVAVTAANKFTIPGPSGNPGSGTGGNAQVSAGTTDSTTATAVVPGHGFSSGQPVTIAGASPSQFNGTFSITVVDADTFTYIITPAAGAATGTITASGNTTTATATTSADHGFANGSPVTVSGANPTGYNGTFTITSVPSTTSFTYTVGSALSTNTASPVFAVQGGSTTVTVTTAVAHNFVTSPPQVTIANSDIAGYNGTFDITVTSPTTFTYTTASVLPANTSGSVTASTTTVPTVTATVANHGFDVVTNNQVVIESTSGDLVHPGTYTVLTVPDANTFTYSTGVVLAAPSGGYTARPPTLSSKAIATVTAHGYSVNNEVVIASASAAAYNGTKTVSRVVDANTFEYSMTTAPSPNTSASVTSSIKTTTARATSVAHGFSTGDSVTIAGATPAAFNGMFTVTVTGPSNFTYAIGSAEGDATGTITASGTASADRTNLIRWVRGEDNFQDENSSGSTTDIRASVHGDVLHSRPAVVNYNRFGGDNDVYIFYGANDGIFHAVKGGRANDTGDTSGLQPGQEAWGFIAQEFFGSLKRMRNNSPTVSSSFKKPYFMDGSIATYITDVNGDGKFVAADGDRVILYITMHRGGRLVYALDVSDPLDPKFMWKIDNATSGFGELGQTWSTPVVVAAGLQGYSSPVLVFGGGYDPAVDDIDPSTVTSFTATAVTTAAGTVNRTMGRAVYVVDALTGALIWRGLGTNSDSSGGAPTTTVSGMDYAIPADITVIKNESGGATNRAYVGDTGGNMWRIDFNSSGGGSNLSGTTVTKIASVAAPGTLPGGLRKFLHGPDVVRLTGFDAVLVGSGDREHPFDTGVVNRFYMFKDKGSDSGPVTGTDPVNAPTIVESAMFDATTNCIQDASACAPGQTQADALTALGNSSGWYITLGSGEKVVGNAVSLGGTTFFNTNQPSAAAGGGACGANLGIARQYQVSTADATATTDLNAGGGLTGADRSSIYAGGGYLPSPVHVVVELGGKPVEAVISGIKVGEPPGTTLQARLRKYWYKEIDR